MRIAVTGAGGFIGRRLVAELQARGRLGSQPIDELILLDQAFHTEGSPGPIPERRILGDVTAPDISNAMFGHRPDAIFHLAAMLTAGAEREFDQGVHTNLHGLWNCWRPAGGRVASA